MTEKLYKNKVAYSKTTYRVIFQDEKGVLLEQTDNSIRFFLFSETFNRYYEEVKTPRTFKRYMGVYESSDGIFTGPCYCIKGDASERKKYLDNGLLIDIIEIDWVEKV